MVTDVTAELGKEKQKSRWKKKSQRLFLGC
jgi:hypothetical protein